MRALMVCVALLPLSQVPAAQTASELFQRALVLERTAGRLDSAIVLYQRVVQEARSDRTLAARALLSLGRAYEMLGRTEARSAYERLLRDYGDQQELVTQARARIAALAPSARQSVAAARGGAMMARRVWHGPDVDPTGTPSLDGRFLSFTDWTTGDLAVHDLSTGTNRRLTDKGPWEKSNSYAEFSVVAPDGKEIAYSWFHATPGSSKAGYELRVVAAQGGSSRLVPLGDVDYVQPYRWSADGKQILAGIQKKGETGAGTLALIDVSDGTVHRVRSFGPSWPTTAAISPDSRWIAFDMPAKDELGRATDIRIIATDGTREHALVEHPAADWAPHWTPDGRGILFLSDRTGSWAAWLLEVADGAARGEPRLVKGDLGRSYPMGFTRNGSFFYSPMRLRDVQVATLDALTGAVIEAAKIVTKSFVGSHLQPDWSPDGRSLAPISMRGSGTGMPGTRALVIVDVATGEQREFAPPLSYFFTPRWSRDGRSILIAGTGSSPTPGWYRIDAATGALSTIVQSKSIGPNVAVE